MRSKKKQSKQEIRGEVAVRKITDETIVTRQHCLVERSMYIYDLSYEQVRTTSLRIGPSISYRQNRPASYVLFHSSTRFQAADRWRPLLGRNCILYHEILF